MLSHHTQIEEEKKNNVVRDLHQHLRLSISSEDWEKFEEQKTDRGRIQVLLGIKKQEIQASVDTKAKLHEVAKDKSKAMVLKNAGNKAFGAGNNESALQSYSECLAWMPHDGSKDVGVVYANRSAALFHLQEYTLALQDAEIAFNLNYPSELHYKLHERAGRCCLQLAKRKEAAKQFQLALASLKNAEGLDEIKASKLKSTLENLLKACPSNSSTSTNKPEEELSLPELSKGPGRYLRNASVKVSVRSNDEEGRFVVANEDIRPGEVIFVEKAFVSTLAQEFCHQQCFQCFRKIRAPVACTNCIAVSFCSPKCRDTAWATHHRYECQILGFLYRSGISIICYMALRILTQGNPLEVLSWYNLANETEEAERKNQESSESNENVCEKEKGDCKKGNVKRDRQPEGEYYRTDHVAIFHLVSHSMKRTTEDNFHRTVMALYLLLSLKRTALFKDILEKKKTVKANKRNETATNGIEEEITEEMIELRLGTLIFRCLKFLQFNTHEIAGWDAEKGKSVYMGGGLFTTLALCNHSCAPAIVRYFVNDTVIVRALRIIRQGEQVTENYGQQYADTSKEDRQKSLKEIFRFDCVCVACKLAWPTVNEIQQNNEMKFRCSFCRRFLCKTSPESFGFLFRCGYCSKETNILKSLKLIHDGEAKYKQGVEFMKKGQIATALGILNEIMVLYDTILIPPFPDFHYCQDALRYCYLGMGNKAILPDHLVDHGSINALHLPSEEQTEQGLELP